MYSRHWLIKFAPFRTSWEEIVARGTFTLRGVRSQEARKHLVSMHLNDPVLFYRSQKDQAVVGILEVSREAYPDPTGADDKWLTCDFRPVRTLSPPVSLATLREDPRLVDIPLLRQPRLAVMPLTRLAFDLIVEKSREST